MRNKKEMMTLILQMAESLPEVLAVGMNGSRTNQNAPKDNFQDYDIVYVVNNLEKLVDNQKWLEAFGELMISQQPEGGELFPPSLGGRYSFLMQFQDGNRIDLMLCPLKNVEEWLKEDALLKILWDPHHILPPVPPASDKNYWVQKPTPQKFQDCCNEFWWVATYVVKGVARKELFYASDHFYENCRGELLRLLSWQVGFATDFSLSVGKNYKYLSRYLPKETMEKIYQLQDLSSLNKISQHLIAIEELFLAESKKLGTEQGWEFLPKEAQRVMAYTKETLKDYL